MQVSHDPTQGYLLIAAVAMVVGLIGSLRRAGAGGCGCGSPRSARRGGCGGGPAGDGDLRSPTVVSVGGLARSDSGNFTTEFDGILERLRAAATVAEPNLMGAGKE